MAELEDDYPDALREALGGYYNTMVSSEQYYARCLELGVTDPEDPRLEAEVLGRPPKGLYSRIAASRLRERLRLAQAGYTRCYLRRDDGIST